MWTLVLRVVPSHLVWMYAAFFVLIAFLLERISAWLVQHPKLLSLVESAYRNFADSFESLSLPLLFFFGLLLVFYLIASFSILYQGLFQMFAALLQRPMSVWMFEGPDAFASLGALLGDLFRRLVPVLTLTLVVLSIVFGAIFGGLFALGSGPVVTPLKLVLVLAITLFASTFQFLFGPTFYFVATRDTGLLDAISTSITFVKTYFRKYVVACLLFWAAGLVVGYSGGISVYGTLHPEYLLQNPRLFVHVLINFAWGFVSLIYWTSIFVAFEDDFDEGRAIAWSN